MDLQQLTKNQEFIHIATNQLIKDGKTDEDIKTLLEEVIPTILENQKKASPQKAYMVLQPYRQLPLAKRQIKKKPHQKHQSMADVA